MVRPSSLNLELNIRSEAGNVRGQLTTDVQAPDFAARGDSICEQLNLAPILRDPAAAHDPHRPREARSVDEVVSRASAPVTDRLGGTFAFERSAGRRRPDTRRAM